MFYVCVCRDLNPLIQKVTIAWVEAFLLADREEHFTIQLSCSALGYKVFLLQSINRCRIMVLESGGLNFSAISEFRL